MTIEEIDRDISALDRADEFNEVFIAARWVESIDRITAGLVARTEPVHVDEILSREDLDARWELICKHYAADVGVPSAQLPADVNRTLDWMKRRVASDYEKTVRRVIDNHMVTSPIEQLFLLEWHYQRVDEACAVTLHPQARVETSGGTYTIDFVVRARSTTEPRGSVAIELDGHEFHEKTKEQVAHDKKRERAIVRAGLPVLRFTGHEIWKNARACVQEVADYFRAPRSPS